MNHPILQALRQTVGEQILFPGGLHRYPTEEKEIRGDLVERRESQEKELEKMAGIYNLTELQLTPNAIQALRK
ncbi:Hypothetical predicted protein, partial [Pelobates cultripes]